MFIEISGVSIKFKRYVFARPLIARISLARRSASSPFDTAPFSPSDPKMPIQILRPIFVAIKYYVFGLMAQKYSILKRGTSLLVSVKRGIKINSGTCGGRKRRASLWHLRRHFHDSSDSRRRSAEEACYEEGISLLRDSPNEKARTWICEPEAAASLLTVASLLFLFLSSFLFLSPWPSARNPKICVCSFSVLVSHAYLEINKDNKIIYIYMNGVFQSGDLNYRMIQ